MLNGIETLAQDFFNNKNVCDEPKNLKIGDKCFILDTGLVDNESDFYAIIPVVVAAVDTSSRIPGRVYYWFRAEGSKIDEQLNVMTEPFQGGVLNYYKYLEHTSPYILLSKPDNNTE
jgi:hypothetical protein